MITLDRYILREQVVPFVFGFSVVTFLLSMDFIFDHLNLFVTKGVPALVVLELYILGLGWMVAISIPCAALVAPLMAFGRMAQDNEITALRASGVHLLRIIRPSILASIVLAILLTLFNNHVLPESNHAYANLLIDITRKKPTLEIQEGIFVNDVKGYSILIEELDERTDEMTNVTIYEAKPNGKPTTIVAKKGRLSFTGDGTTLTLDLRDGEIHEVPDVAQPAKYRRVKFDRHRLHIKDFDTSLKRRSRDSRSDREMSTRDMLDRIETLETQRAGFVAEIDTLAIRGGLSSAGELLDRVGKKDNVPWWQAVASMAGGVINLGPGGAPGPTASSGADSTGVTLAEADIARVRVKEVEIAAIDRRKNALWVEIHKKFALPIACVVFVLVGAPLGIRARRGGVTAGFFSVIFFLFYYVCLIGGEQLADRSLLPPWLAMWLANLVLGTGGVLFTLRTIEVGRSGARPSPPTQTVAEAA